MARINLLDTRTTSFGELISNGKNYQVPIFQRDYSWQEENWDDLWDDILALHTNSNSSHYMGALVLQNSNSDKNLTIIDGQQRLATLSIIAIVVIDKIQKLVEIDQSKEANQERVEILRRTYISDKDPRSLRYSSKITLNETNNDFYQSNLINLRKPLNIRAIVKSNQLLWRAFEYFSKHIEELKDIISSGEKLAEFLTDTIAQRLIFIQITVENELNAYTVLETLNSRGIELSSTDLLKNYLFSLFPGPDDLQEARRQWRRIITTVQMEKFPELLRYYLSLKYPKIKGGRLFKVVRESVQEAEQAFALLDQLENYSSLYSALGNAHDDFWQDHPENRSYIRELELFRVKQVYPTLFAAYTSFLPEDFTRLLKLICVFSFRYNVVCHLNPSELEILYNKVANLIAKGEITTPKQVFDHLRPAYVPDEKFRQDFCLLAIPTKGQKKKLVRYILGRLEKDVSGLEINEDSFSIEHILPESISSNWRQNFDDNVTELMVYRLGNLTPLEPSLNRDAGSNSFPVKRGIYQRSSYKLTQNILAEEWTPDAISRRQEDLAKRAIHIWSSDFGNQ